jgi:hypothetical protein
MIINAAITPGIHPQMVNINTITIDPQPLSITAKGGNKIESSTLQIFINTNLQLILSISQLQVVFVTTVASSKYILVLHIF